MFIYTPYLGIYMSKIPVVGKNKEQRRLRLLTRVRCLEENSCIVKSQLRNETKDISRAMFEKYLLGSIRTVNINYEL